LPEASPATAPAPAAEDAGEAAPVRITSAGAGFGDPGPDSNELAQETLPQPVGATFLLTPDRRNDGLTPTRVLGVVFHVLVESLNFNLIPAIMLGGITAWFTMRGVKRADVEADEAGSGWVV
jgi:hypothetical protein